MLFYKLREICFICISYYIHWKRNISLGEKKILFWCGKIKLEKPFLIYHINFPLFWWNKKCHWTKLVFFFYFYLLRIRVIDFDFSIFRFQIGQETITRIVSNRYISWPCFIHFTFWNYRNISSRSSSHLYTYLYLYLVVALHCCCYCYFCYCFCCNLEIVVVVVVVIPLAYIIFYFCLQFFVFFFLRISPISLNLNLSLDLEKFLYSPSKYLWNK